ncbi:hypothetical protein HZS_5806, partial [Henneguya salminicola]
MSATLIEVFNIDENSEKELNNLLAESEKFLDNFDEFADKTSTDLTRFELKNINLIKEINEKQHDVEKFIDESMEIIEKYEKKLCRYEKSLVNIRSNFEELEMFSVWEQKQKNSVELFKELSNIMTTLDINKSIMDSFFDLSAKSLSLEMLSFSQNLLRAYRRKLPAGADQILGIKAQIQYVDNISLEFCDRFTDFIYLLIKQELKNVPEQSEPSTHDNVHNRLNIYSSIVKSIKILNPVKFSELNNLSVIFVFVTKDVIKSKKEGNSILYRDVEDIKQRSQKIEEILTRVLNRIDSVSKGIGDFGNIFFSFKVVVNFIESFLDRLIDEFSKVDHYYLVTCLSTFLTESEKPCQNDYFAIFLKRIPSTLNEQLKIFTSSVTQLLDSKKSKKTNISELIKMYKEFLTVCINIVPKSNEENPLISQLYIDVLNKLVDVIENSFVETGDKTSKEIYLIGIFFRKFVQFTRYRDLSIISACLNDFRIASLSDCRKNIKTRYVNEITKFIENSMTASFGVLLVTSFASFKTFLKEVTSKVDACVSESNIQAYIYNNRQEYKKFTKDLNLKNVKKYGFDFQIKKSIDKMHKIAKKQFQDLALFTTVWNLMVQQIMSQITKIDTYLKKYCTRVPE